MSNALAKPVSYGPSSAADPNEGRSFGSSFWVSAGVHALGLALLVGFTLAVKEKIDAQPATFELVRGEGDDFMATEAPSGHEAGQAKEGPIEFTAPESVPSWTPPAPAPAEVTPVEPLAATPVQPLQKAEPVKTPPVVEPKPNFTQNIKSAIRQEKRKAEREVKAQRAADAKAAAERTSYEQFQKQNASKTKSTAKSSGAGVANATPGPRIDASGIKKGVTGGTGAGSTGAGGTALARAEANAMDAYFVMLRTRLLSSHELPGGVSDLLSAEVQFTIASNGSVSGVRIVRSSGSKDFDQSVLEAFGRLKMPGRPDKKTDVQRLTFRIKEA